MTKQLLIEKFSFRFALTEDKDSGKLVARGQFGYADKPTENKRIYSRELMSRELNRLFEAIAQRKVLGEADHPADGKTKLTRASHIITALEMGPDGEIIGEAEIMDTPNGKILRAIHDAGGALGVSSRGYGSVAKNKQGFDVVQEDFVLDTYDFVVDPAQRDAYPTVAVESSSAPAANLVTEENEVKDPKVECGADMEGEKKDAVAEANVPSLPEEGKGSEGASPEADANGGGLTAVGDTPTTSNEAEKPRTTEAKDYVPGVLTNPDGSCRPNPNAESTEIPGAAADMVGPASSEEEPTVEDVDDDAVDAEMKTESSESPELKKLLDPLRAKVKDARAQIAKKGKSSNEGGQLRRHVNQMVQKMRKIRDDHHKKVLGSHADLAKKHDLIPKKESTEDMTDTEKKVAEAIERVRAQVTEEVTSRLMSDPQVAGARRALASVKSLLLPYVVESDVAAIVESKDLEIATLRAALKTTSTSGASLAEENVKYARAVKDLGFSLLAVKALESVGHPKPMSVLESLGDLNRFEDSDALVEALAPAMRAAKGLAESSGGALAAENARLKADVAALSARLEQAGTNNKKLVEERDAAEAKARGAVADLYIEKKIAATAGAPQAAIAIRKTLSESREPITKDFVDRTVENFSRRGDGHGSQDFQAVRRGIRGATRPQGQTTIVEDSVRETVPPTPKRVIRAGGIEIDPEQVNRLARV